MNACCLYLKDNWVAWFVEIVASYALVKIDLSVSSSGELLDSLTSNFTTVLLTLFSAYIAIYALISTSVAKICIEIAQKMKNSQNKYWEMAEQNISNVGFGIFEGIFCFVLLVLCYLIHDIFTKYSSECFEFFQIITVFCITNIFWQLVENIRTLHMLSTSLVLVAKHQNQA